MTFSVTGRCARTGMLGVAITTSSIAVGARCPHVRAGVGAVASQNVTNPALGPGILARLAQGAVAPGALTAAMATDVAPDYRQVAVVSHDGTVAIHSGPNSLGRHSHAVGDGVVAAGNLLATEDLPHIMVDEFTETAEKHLADRLLGALEAGLNAGGEEGPVHSAALLVADVHPFPLVDLRVDWDEADPVGRLRALWHDYAPQMGDYVTRAVAPGSAPSYGVPGDD